MTKYIGGFLLSLIVLFSAVGFTVFDERQCIDRDLRQSNLPGIENISLPTLSLSENQNLDLRDLEDEEYRLDEYFCTEYMLLGASYPFGTSISVAEELDEDTDFRVRTSYATCNTVNLLNQSTLQQWFDATDEEGYIADRSRELMTYVLGEVPPLYDGPYESSLPQWFVIDRTGEIVSELGTVGGNDEEPLPAEFPQLCRELDCNGSSELELNVDGDTYENNDPGEKDIDNDGLLDADHAAEVDTDGDGIRNEFDGDIDCDGLINEEDDDMDGDEIPNEEDEDEDGDGIPDEDEEENGGDDSEGDDSGEDDSGDADSGENDSGDSDSGENDSGEANSGNADSGGDDSGCGAGQCGPDSGETDSGETDSGNADSGENDSGEANSGGNDSGCVAGQCGDDSGETDSGGTDDGGTDSDGDNEEDSEEDNENEDDAGGSGDDEEGGLGEEEAEEDNENEDDAGGSGDDEGGGLGEEEAEEDNEYEDDSGESTPEETPKPELPGGENAGGGGGGGSGGGTNAGGAGNSQTLTCAGEAEICLAECLTSMFMSSCTERCVSKENKCKACLSVSGGGDETETQCACKFFDHIYLNTDIPFVGSCVLKRGGSDTNPNESSIPDLNTVFPRFASGMSKLFMAMIVVGGLLAIVVAGFMMTLGGATSGNTFNKGKEILIGIAAVFLLLGISGILLNLINPNFFGTDIEPAGPALNQGDLSDPVDDGASGNANVG